MTNGEARLRPDRTNNIKIGAVRKGSALGLKVGRAASSAVKEREVRPRKFSPMEEGGKRGGVARHFFLFCERQWWAGGGGAARNL